VRQSGPLRSSVGLIPMTAKPGRVSAVLELAQPPRDVIVSQAHHGKAHNVKDLARVVEQRAHVGVWHDTEGEVLRSELGPDAANGGRRHHGGAEEVRDL